MHADHKAWFRNGLSYPRINWSTPPSRTVMRTRNFCFRKWLQDMQRRYIVHGPNAGEWTP